MNKSKSVQPGTEGNDANKEVLGTGGVELTRIKTAMDGIASAGYDALYAILELEFIPDGQVWQFYDVPEQVWYAWRNTESCISFFHTNIAGKYRAKQISGS